MHPFGNALGNSIVSNRINAEQIKRNAMLASDALSQQTNGRLNQQLDSELQQRAGVIANDVASQSQAQSERVFKALAYNRALDLNEAEAAQSASRSDQTLARIDAVNAQSAALQAQFDGMQLKFDTQVARGKLSAADALQRGINRGMHAASKNYQSPDLMAGVDVEPLKPIEKTFGFEKRVENGITMYTGVNRYDESISLLKDLLGHEGKFNQNDSRLLNLSKKSGPTATIDINNLDPNIYAVDSIIEVHADKAKLFQYGAGINQTMNVGSGNDPEPFGDSTSKKFSKTGAAGLALDALNSGLQMSENSIRRRITIVRDVEFGDKVFLMQQFAPLRLNEKLYPYNNDRETVINILNGKVKF